MKYSLKTLSVLLIPSVIFFCAGCGQTGPLYLPPAEPPIKHVQTQ